MYQIPDYRAKPINPATIPPDEKRLRMMLDNNLVDVVKDCIEKFKLPYFIETSAEGKPTLKDTLSVGELHLKKFITEEPSTIAMKEQAKKMAKTPYEVLITGETGTGKEIIAKSMIADRKGEVKAVNCAGFPEHLIEAELFGYERGAFTGAETKRDGLMTSAADGVMFLDEVSELPLVMQAKLLRAIQEKRIRKVGSNKSEDITCKFVFASNRDLKVMVKDGLFRKDLYARISTLELDILPLLPKRKCDIIPITKSLQGGDKFLEKYQTELMTGILDLSLNVRSIQQYVIRYAVLGELSV